MLVLSTEFCDLASSIKAASSKILTLLHVVDNMLTSISCHDFIIMVLLY